MRKQRAKAEQARQLQMQIQEKEARKAREKEEKRQQDLKDLAGEDAYTQRGNTPASGEVPSPVTATLLTVVVCFTKPSPPC